MSAVQELIQHRCTRCFRTLSAELAEVGTEQTCEHCGQLLLVPGPETLAEEFGSYLPARSRTREQSYGSETNLGALAGFMVGQNAPLAPLWKRFLGSLVDNVLLVVAFVVGVFLVGGLISQGLFDRQALESKELNLVQLNAQAVIYFPVVMLLIVQWNFIASRGQSLGKMLLGMKIVDRQGGNPGFIAGVILRNWLRAALAFVPFFSLIDAVVIFGESRRCLHDYLAGTHVVEAE